MRRQTAIAGIVGALGLIAAGVALWPVAPSAPPPRPAPRAPQQPAQPLPAVHGRVVDEAGRPLPGATVRCDETAVQTDPAGAFACPMWDEGAHTLVAYATGYADLRQTGHAALRVHLASPRARGPHRLVLRRPGVVRGHVVRGAQPVVGATLSVAYRVARGLTRDLPPFRLERLATTDARGAFTLEGLPSGRLQLHAVGPDTAAGASAVLDLQPGGDHKVLVRLLASASVSVSVRSRSGAPLQARITLTRAGTLVPLAQTADARGVARFDGVPADRWTLAATAPGHAPGAAVQLDVRPHGALSESLVLEPLSGVAGVVVDPKGKPVVAAGVVLRCPSGTTTVQSRLAGAFRWAEPTQPCEAVAVHPRFAPSATRRATPGVPLRLQLKPGGRVLGKVVDAEGEPVPSALVRFGARAVGPLDPLGPPQLQPLHSQPDGSFRSATLRPGTYALHGTATGHGPGTLRGLVVRAGQDTHATLRLDGGGWVVGTLRGSDGEPVGGAQVRLLDHGWAMAATSQDDGTFRIGPAPGGRYLLTATSTTELPARVEQLQVPDKGELAQDLQFRVSASPVQVAVVGAGLRETAAGLTFVDVQPLGPAAQAGVHNGDRVISVDFQNAEVLGTRGVAKALEGASVQVTAEVVGPDGHARSVYLTPAGPDPDPAP